MADGSNELNISSIEERIVKLLEDNADILKELGELKEKMASLNSKNEKEKEKLRGVIERGESRLAELQEEFDQIAKRIEKLMSPPNPFGYFLRFNDPATADIIQEGRLKRVSIDPAVDNRALKIGLPLILKEGTGTILNFYDKPNDYGRKMTFRGFLGDNEALVGDGMDTNDLLSVFISYFVDRDKLQVGATVLVGDNFIWKLIQTKEEAKKSDGSGLDTGDFILADMPDVKFEDIGGLDQQLNEIRKEIEDPYLVPELYKAYDIPTVTHVILYGLPGNGKTMIAKAIARSVFEDFKDKILPYAKGNFFSIRGPELESKFVGVAEKELRNIFDSAADLAKKSGAPVFIFFDDCEAFLKARGSGISSDANMGYVTQFTTCLQGVRDIKGVNLILATNRLDLIDAAVLRRMHRKFRIPGPTNKLAARHIFNLKLRNLPLDRAYFNEEKYPELKADHQLVLDYVLDKLISNIFENNSRNIYMRIHLRDGTIRESRIYELLSGQIIADMVNGAKKISKDRDKALTEDQRPSGIRIEDLEIALDRELKGNESLPSTKLMVQNWLDQMGVEEEVESFEKLLGREVEDTSSDNVQ